MLKLYLEMIILYVNITFQQIPEIYFLIKEQLQQVNYFMSQSNQQNLPQILAAGTQGKRISAEKYFSFQRKNLIHSQARINQVQILPCKQQDDCDNQSDQTNKLRSIFVDLNRDQQSDQDFGRETPNQFQRQLQQSKFIKSKQLLPRFTKAIRNQKKVISGHKFTNYYLIKRLVNFKQNSRQFKRVNKLKTEQIKQNVKTQIQTSNDLPKNIERKIQAPKNIIQIYQLSDGAKAHLGNSKIHQSQRQKYSSRLSSYLRIKSQQSALLSSNENHCISKQNHKSNYDLPKRYVQSRPQMRTQNQQQITIPPKIKKNNSEQIRNSEYIKNPNIRLQYSAQIVQNQNDNKKQNSNLPRNSKLVKQPNSVEVCKNLNLKYQKIKEQIVKRHQKSPRKYFPVPLGTILHDIKSSSSKYDIPNLIKRSKKIQQKFINKSNNTVQKLNQMDKNSGKRANQVYRKYNQISIQQIIKDKTIICPDLDMKYQQFNNKKLLLMTRIGVQSQSVINDQSVLLRNLNNKTFYQENYRKGKQTSLSTNQIQRTLPTIVNNVSNIKKMK